MKQMGIYYSPAVKVICVENNTVLCASPEDFSSTERYSLGSNSYDEDDWE